MVNNLTVTRLTSDQTKDYAGLLVTCSLLTLFACEGALTVVLVVRYVKQLGSVKLFPFRLEAREYFLIASRWHKVQHFCTIFGVIAIRMNLQID